MRSAGKVMLSMLALFAVSAPGAVAYQLRCENRRATDALYHSEQTLVLRTDDAGTRFTSRIDLVGPFATELVSEDAGTADVKTESPFVSEYELHGETVRGKLVYNLYIESGSLVTPEGKTTRFRCLPEQPTP